MPRSAQRTGVLRRTTAVRASRSPSVVRYLLDIGPMGCLGVVRMVVALTAALAAIVVASPARADPDEDETFLQTLHNQGIHINEPVAQGHSVCLAIKRNPERRFADVARGVARSDPTISQVDAAFFTGAAIAAYCPQYELYVDDGS